MNFVLTSFLLLAVPIATALGLTPEVVTLLMVVGGFLIPLGTALVCGWLSDERFLAYALYALVGYLIPVVPGLFSSGLFALLMIAVGVMGAFNGAVLAARASARKRQRLRRRLGLSDLPDDELKGGL